MTDAASVQGQPYLIAAARTRLAQALLAENRLEEALAELDAVRTSLAALQQDPEFDRRRLLHMTSMSLPPPGLEYGDIDSLQAWVLVARASTLARLERWSDAQEAVAEARPLARGWGRKNLRQMLDAVDDGVTRAVGSSGAAIGAIDRIVSDPTLDDDERLAVRYERSVHLVEVERFDDAMREALLLVRDTDADPALQARARQVLGAALAGLGRDDEATTALRGAFDAFATLSDHPATLAAAPGLAWRLSESGEYDAASDVATRALHSARALNAPAAQADLLTILGTSRDAAGQRAAAVDAFEEASAIADRAGDLLRGADARHGEAIALMRDGSPEDCVEALALLDAARASYDTLGLPERSAGCQHESAALLGRLHSYPAARTRYLAARDAYLDIPEVLRSADPAAVADCTANLAALDAREADPATPPPARAFASGGHHMQHAEWSA